MWEYKEFNSYTEQQRWIIDNENKYQIDIVFIENGFCVEYRKLKIINI